MRESRCVSNSNVALPKFRKTEPFGRRVLLRDHDGSSLVKKFGVRLAFDKLNFVAGFSRSLSVLSAHLFLVEIEDLVEVIGCGFFPSGFLSSDVSGFVLYILEVSFKIDADSK